MEEIKQVECNFSEEDTLKLIEMLNSGKLDCGPLMAMPYPKMEIINTNQYAIGSNHWPGLGKLTEECGEVLQVLGKLVGSNGSTEHWSGDLRKMMVEELGDLQAAIFFFIRLNKLDDKAITERMVTKLCTFEKWHQDNKNG